MVTLQKSLVNSSYTREAKVQLNSKPKLCLSLFSSFDRKKQRTDDEITLLKFAKYSCTSAVSLTCFTDVGRAGYNLVVHYSPSKCRIIN